MDNTEKKTSQGRLFFDSGVCVYVDGRIVFSLMQQKTQVGHGNKEEAEKESYRSLVSGYFFSWKVVVVIEERDIIYISYFYDRFRPSIASYVT